MTAWGIASLQSENGHDHDVTVVTDVRKAFGDLLHFKVEDRAEMPRKVLLITPISGHYATFLRPTIVSLLQLASFISMHPEKHAKAFAYRIHRVTQADATNDDNHNTFYDEYLAVMDMTVEFYLSTVERIFKGLEIAKNEFYVAVRKIEIDKITSVAVKTVESS